MMPRARGLAPARRDPPETRWRRATKEEDGRAPLTAAGRRAAVASLSAYVVASALTATPAGITPVST